MSLTVFILLRSQSHMCFFSTRSLVPISSFTNVLFVRFSYKLLFPFTLHLARFLSNFLSHSHDSLFLTISFSFSFSLFRSCLMLTFFSNTFFLSLSLFLFLYFVLSYSFSTISLRLKGVLHRVYFSFHAVSTFLSDPWGNRRCRIIYRTLAE